MVVSYIKKQKDKL